MLFYLIIKWYNVINMINIVADKINKWWKISKKIMDLNNNINVIKWNWSRFELLVNYQ